MASNEIFKAVEAIKKSGCSLPENLQAEISNLENPKYRVAVVGKFQAGKTTLINHVFLQDNPILLEGCGLCTTSVTTEVEYGPSPRLEVYHWEDSQKISDKLATAIDNPTPEELKSVTVGEDRVALANTVSRVKFCAPVDALQRYVILDTPGIDDPNPDILQNTTYRIIPGCDLALLVTDAKQLDEVELDLLRKNLICDGIARIMVLISYRPEDCMTEMARKAVVDTVKAQLAGIGKDNVPVEMYCFSEGMDDILCSSGEISLALNSFLNENALAGREEHVEAHLRVFLNNCLTDVASKAKTAEQTSEEKRELASRIQEQKKIAHEKCERVMSELKDEFDRIKHSSKGLVESKIGPIFIDFSDKLDEAKDLTAAQKILKNADEKLKMKLSDAVNECVFQVEQKVRNVLLEKDSTIKSIFLDWNGFLQDELGVGDGFMTKIPSIALEVANVIILNVLLPGGYVIAIIGRLLQAITPIIKTFELGSLLKSVMVAKAKSAISEAQEKTIEDVYGHICESLDEALPRIRKSIESQYQVQADTVISNIESAQVEDKKTLENKMNAIKDIMASL